ncbi:MAG: PPOX class F420-dependent oxidoreductase [Ilumatobacteraceae bacterium]
MIPVAYEDLLVGTNTAILVTLAADGAPHASPVWFLYEDGRVVVSTTADRQKHRNLVRDPRVAFTVVDPAKPLRYLEVRGTAALAADDGNVVRDRIAAKHGFADGGAFDAPGARRVNVTIVPSRIIEH